MTAQELYAAVRAAIDEKIAIDPMLRHFAQHVRDGVAGYLDTMRYNDKVSEIIGEVFSKHVGVDGLEQGAREAVCEMILKDMYDGTNERLAEAQRVLDEAQGLQLTPQKAPYPAERVQTLAHALEDPTIPIEKIQRRANAPVTTVARSFQDDYVKTNASHRSRLGIKCYLTRDAVGGCCAWCQDVAGRYAYGDEPDDIYRRHDNCGCRVTFENGRERQNVWTKKTWTASDAVKDYEPQRMTQEQAQTFEQKRLSETRRRKKQKTS